MKKLNPVKSLSAFLLIGSVIIIGGCKKEAPVVPNSNQTITQLPEVTKKSVQLTEADNFFIGYLGNEPVKFEGSAVSYSAYVDPDSAHAPSGHGPDNDSYYLSGSKWVTMTGTGMSMTPTVNASVEIRSLAVRVFVSPITPVSTIYYNLLSPMSYPFADGDDSNTGAFVTIRDKNGVMWTSQGDQDGSRLVITSRGPNLNSYTVVSGTITCKMYNTQGDVKQVNGAHFTAALGI